MWHKMEDKQPKDGQLITAIGNVDGEVYGTDKGLSIASGEFKGYIEIPADAYYSRLVNIIYWRPIGKLPEGVQLS